MESECVTTQDKNTWVFELSQHCGESEGGRQRAIVEESQMTCGRFGVALRRPAFQCN